MKRQVQVTNSISKNIGLDEADIEHTHFEKQMLINVLNREYKGLGAISQISKKATSHMIKVGYGTNSIPHNLRQAVLGEFQHVTLDSDGQYDIYHLEMHKSKDCKNKRIVDRSIEYYKGMCYKITSVTTKVVIILALFYITLHVLKYIKPEKY